MHDTVILSVAIIGVLGLGAQWLAWRMQAPAIVLMSIAGLLVGPIWSIATGGDPLLDPAHDFGDLMRPIIALAVAVILFEGGLVLRFSDLRDAGPAVRRLVLLGGPIAWFLGSLVCYYAAGLSWGASILFAGVLIVTGPTVIMPLLRQSKLGGRSGKALKWEGIVNDPIGALYGVVAFEVIRVTLSGENVVMITLWIIFAAAFGAALGVITGAGLAVAFRKGWIPEYLKAPVILVSVIATYAIADMVEAETGLVAVTAFGMSLANSKLASLQELRRFKENIAVLLISGVFVILTASLEPQTILDALNWRTALFLVLMLFVVRPLSVWLSTIGTLNRNEALLVGWIAPRGIVAVAISGFFAQKLQELGVDGADQIVPLAFAIVFTTVVAHGFTIGPLAERLGLSHTGVPGVLLVGANAWSTAFAQALKKAKIDVILADANWRRLRPAVESGVSTFYGETTSEDAEMKLDHARFAHLITVSANDPYNALVSRHFAPELGRHRVFQLAGTESDDDDRGFSVETRGRTLIKRGRTYDSLIRDHYRGWVFSVTELTDKYTLDIYRSERPNTDLIIEIRPDRTLNILGANQEARGGKGAVIIGFGPADSDSKSVVSEDQTEAFAKSKPQPADLPKD